MKFVSFAWLESGWFYWWLLLIYDDAAIAVLYASLTFSFCSRALFFFCVLFIGNALFLCLFVYYFITYLYIFSVNIACLVLLRELRLYDLWLWATQDDRNTCARIGASPSLQNAQWANATTEDRHQPISVKTRLMPHSYGHIETHKEVRLRLIKRLYENFIWYIRFAFLVYVYSALFYALLQFYVMLWCSFFLQSINIWLYFICIRAFI